MEANRDVEIRIRRVEWRPGEGDNADEERSGTVGLAAGGVRFCCCFL